MKTMNIFVRLVVTSGLSYLRLTKFLSALLMVCLLIGFQGCSTMKTGRFFFHVPQRSTWEDMEVQYIQAPDATRLAYRQAGSSHASKVLIIVPGSTMYGYYYVPFMMANVRDWLTIRTIDLRGHGDSYGPRGDVPEVQSLIDDLYCHIRSIKKVNPDAKIIVAGHSMGAGICGKYMEKFGYDSVDGVICFAPFFHWRQPGMKSVKYVEVSLFKTFFGTSHTVTQVYHPTSNDPKLVRSYTKIMSKASMVTDYGKFRESHATPALYMIGKRDELFDWEESQKILKDWRNLKVVVIDDAAHLDIMEKGSAEVLEWIQRM